MRPSSAVPKRNGRGVNDCRRRDRCSAALDAALEGAKLTEKRRKPGHPSARLYDLASACLGQAWSATRLFAALAAAVLFTAVPAGAAVRVRIDLAAQRLEAVTPQGETVTGKSPAAGGVTKRPREITASCAWRPIIIPTNMIRPRCPTPSSFRPAAWPFTGAMSAVWAAALPWLRAPRGSECGTTLPVGGNARRDDRNHWRAPARGRQSARASRGGASGGRAPPHDAGPLPTDEEPSFGFG